MFASQSCASIRFSLSSIQSSEVRAFNNCMGEAHKFVHMKLTSFYSSPILLLQFKLHMFGFPVLWTLKM